MDLDAEEDDDSRRRRFVAAALHGEVAAMNLDNFLVRPQRRLVERFQRPESWGPLSAEDRMELAMHVAGLPAQLDAEPEESNRFDLLLLNLELALIRSLPAFARLRDQVKAIASILEEKAAIPMVQAQLPLIEELQTEDKQAA